MGGVIHVHCFGRRIIDHHYSRNHSCRLQRSFGGGGRFRRKRGLTGRMQSGRKNGRFLIPLIPYHTFTEPFLFSAAFPSISPALSQADDSA